MDTARINYINIGLMLGSAAVAFALPFWLFLISYAVLGPLHYLTELSWLHDRNYFANRRSDGVVLAVMAFMTVVGVALTTWSPDFTVTWLESWGAEFTLVPLGLALVFVLTRGSRGRLIGILTVILITILAHSFNTLARATEDSEQVPTLYDVLFNLYLATIIHVFVFTGAFILWGALKANSRSGVVSFWVFLACATVCLLAPAQQTPVSEYLLTSYDEASGTLLWWLMDDLPFYDTPTPDMVFGSPPTVQVGRFIAFSYTYHYLNWFSKTSIIKWHEVPKTRAIGILVIWVASLALYSRDYVGGLRWLFLLSMLHVLLEFPLNWRSLIGIGQELGLRIRRSLRT